MRDLVETLQLWLLLRIFVGFGSLGTFSRTFRAVVGESPSAYRARFAGEGSALRVPACWAMAWLRPAG